MANLIGIILCVLLAVLIAFFGYLLFEKKKGDAQIIEKLKAENNRLKEFRRKTIKELVAIGKDVK